MVLPILLLLLIHTNTNTLTHVHLHYNNPLIQIYTYTIPLSNTQLILQQQDDQLDRVGASVSTLKRMGETIGDELDDQQM